MSEGTKPRKASSASKQQLTALGLAALKPGEWANDAGTRGAGQLQARKLSTGAVGFYYRYTAPGRKQERLPLGVGLSLAEARKQAAELSRRYQAGDRNLRAILEGEQRAAEQGRRAAQAAAEAAQVRAEATMALLMAAYVKHLKDAGKPSHREVERAIERNITEPWPAIAALPADQVTVDDVMPVFHRITKEGKLREAEKLRAYLRAAYTAARKARTDATMHAFAGFQIRVNPLDDLDVSRPKEAVEKAAEAARERKRAMSEAQLAAYWRRIGAAPTKEGEPPSLEHAVLRFHLLTGGQRVEQLVRLTAADYDADQKTITLRDTKGRRRRAYEHVVPLLPEAEDALNLLRGDGGEYLLSYDQGKTPINYHQVWEAIQAVAREMSKAGEVDRLFTPGTIRKTVETRLAAKGVPDEVLARLSSHGLGGVQARNYNAHRYDDEKRGALRTFRALFVPKGKVVQFKRK